MSYQTQKSQSGTFRSLLLCPGRNTSLVHLICFRDFPSSPALCCLCTLGSSAPQTPALLSLMGFSWTWSSSAWKSLDRLITQKGWDGKCFLWGNVDPLLHGEAHKDPATVAFSSSLCKQLRERLTWKCLCLNLSPCCTRWPTEVWHGAADSSHQSCAQSPGFQKKPFVADPYLIMAIIPALHLHVHCLEQDSSFWKKSSNAEKIGTVQAGKY